MGVREPKSKIEDSVLWCHMENLRPKNGSILSRTKKRRSNLKERDRQTDIRTDRRADKVNDKK